MQRAPRRGGRATRERWAPVMHETADEEEK
jgi:hypothetical protein